MDAWSYEPAADLGRSAADRMRQFPRCPDMTLYAIRSTLQIAARGFLRFYSRLEVRGRENLPAHGSFVMVCNHASHLDALCLLSSLPLRRVHRAFPAAAADYFFSSLPRSFFSTVVVNGLPFDRTHHSAGSLEVCRQLLHPGAHTTGAGDPDLARPGNVLIIFPEGTRSSSGTVGRFRSGIGRLVAGTATPVVPCHLAGAHEAWPKGTLLPRPRKLRLHIGHPRVFLDVSPADPDAVALIGARLRDDVLALARGGPKTLLELNHLLHS
jgi:1-acyl-sn-glycerol-3-phosphate acyltransferase